MTLRTVYEKLFEAERETLDLIAESYSSRLDQVLDYSKMEGYLSIARIIGQARSAIAEMSDFNEIASPSSPEESPCKQIRSSEIANKRADDLRFTHELQAEQPLEEGQQSGYPVYFVLHEKLYKVGRKQDSADTFYKKSVPLEDVWRIIEALMPIAANGEPTTISRLEKQLGFPQYKIQLTIMALIVVKQFRSAGRGRYAFAGKEYPSPQLWMNLLDELPKRGDLLDKI